MISRMTRTTPTRTVLALFAGAALVLSTAGSCGGAEQPAPPAQQLPPGDGVPNDGDGDADG